MFEAKKKKEVSPLYTYIPICTLFMSLVRMKESITILCLNLVTIETEVYSYHT